MIMCAIYHFDYTALIIPFWGISSCVYTCTRTCMYLLSLYRLRITIRTWTSGKYWAAFAAVHNIHFNTIHIRAGSTISTPELVQQYPHQNKFNNALTRTCLTIFTPELTEQYSHQNWLNNIHTRTGSTIFTSEQVQQYSHQNWLNNIHTRTGSTILTSELI